MSNPFEFQKAPQQATASSSPRLRDTAAPAAQLLQRRKRVARAVKLLDLLTTGDQGLHDYLTAQAAQAPQPEQGTFARGVSVDPVAVLVETPPPPLGSVDFQSLKAALLEQCRKTVAEEFKVLDMGRIYSRCGIPGCCIHEFEPTGNILHHYEYEEINTDLLRRIKEMCEPTDVSYIEAYGSKLVPVREPLPVN